MNRISGTASSETTRFDAALRHTRGIVPRALTALAGLLLASDLTLAQSPDCKINRDLRAGNATDIAEDNFRCLAQRLETLEKNYENLSEQLAITVTPDALTSAVAAMIPAGVVVAFDGSNDNRCPKDWMLFVPAGGRVIVGAGPHSNLDQNRESLSNYFGRPDLGDEGRRGANGFRLETAGGEEKHKLRPIETPRHAHYLNMKIKKFYISGGGRKQNLFVPDETRQAVTENAGAGKAHNNMPPYIALYFCKKK